MFISAHGEDCHCVAIEWFCIDCCDRLLICPDTAHGMMVADRGSVFACESGMLPEISCSMSVPAQENAISKTVRTFLYLKKPLFYLDALP